MKNKNFPYGSNDNFHLTLIYKLENPYSYAWLFSRIGFNYFIYKNTENFMVNDQISPNDNNTNDVSRRVYGTPSIEELQMRVLARELEKRKQEKRKKSK